MNVIHEVLSNGDRYFIDSIPFASEIKAAVHELDHDSSPGPDGFGGWFYRKCWGIIDDMFLFCNGDKRNIKRLMKTLTEYQEASGQVISSVKSKCFVGGTTNTRKKTIAEECNMQLSTFPDKYLGVMLFPGKVKSSHVWGIVKQLQSYLAGWKGKMLAFQERLIFFCSIPVYNMSIYRCPRSVLKECEKIIRNFLWSGDPNVRKLITLKWDNVCSPLEEGGLGIKRLDIINRALLMNLAWNVQQGEDEWTLFLQAKFK
ncbi:uncharacterized protein LOC113315607 [Papaver somniferum]|uniref:uncharacterized protein LOC113315607 n=1 Tax=Papaver somniferum TaxID=3469 RepID=UPI000E70192E|nr:uncharacterized protein LOC113315607 [Papaver somniferum]